MPQSLKKVTPEYAKKFYGVNVIQGSVTGTQQISGQSSRIENIVENIKPVTKAIEQKTGNENLF